ncbi:unnamed protein product [Boreogadus saida]
MNKLDQLKKPVSRSVWTSDCWPLLNPSVTVEENGPSWQQACTNLGFSLPLTCPSHLCKACGSHFDSLAHKHVCGDCKKNFCGRCSVEAEARQPRLCWTCRRFHGTLFNRTQLMRLKVRELRDYLHLHEVRTDRCREKEELVELVLDQQALGGSGGTAAAGSGCSAAPNGATNGAAPQTQLTAPSSSDDNDEEDDDDDEEDDDDDDEDGDDDDDDDDDGEGDGGDDDEEEDDEEGEEEDEGDENADEGEADGGDESERVAEEDVGDNNVREAEVEENNEREVAEEEEEEEEDDDEEEEAGEDEEEVEENIEALDPDEAVPAEARTASLSDLSCVEDIEGLGVRQLKEILSRNFVNFMGCCEKWELMERVTRLYNEVRDEESAAATKPDEELCRICMDYPVDCVLLECGHMVTCSRCGKRMSECPICRQYIVRVVHVFRS